MAPPVPPIDDEALAEFRNAQAEFRASLFSGYAAEIEVQRAQRSPNLDDSLEEYKGNNSNGHTHGTGSKSPGGKSNSATSPGNKSSTPSSPRGNNKSLDTNGVSPVGLKSPGKKKSSVCCCASAEDVVEPVLGPRKDQITSRETNTQQVVVESVGKQSDLKVEEPIDAPNTPSDSIESENPEKTLEDVNEESGVESDKEPEPDAPNEPFLSPAQLTRLLHACDGQITTAVEDLREEVRGAACVSIQSTCDAATFFPILRNIISPTVCDQFAPALLRVTAREVDKAASNRGYFALVRCAGVCHDPRFLELIIEAYFAVCRSPDDGQNKTNPRLVSKYEPSEVSKMTKPAFRNETLRTRVLDVISRILADWPSDVLYNDQVYEQLVAIVVAGLDDPSVSVRKSARISFEIFQEIWPKAGEEIMLRQMSHTRDFVENASLVSHIHTRDGAQWARGCTRAAEREESRHVKSVLEEARNTRYEVFHATTEKFDTIEDAQQRRLAVDSPDRNGRSIAASRPVEWPSSPPPPPPQQGPALLWDDGERDSNGNSMDPLMKRRLLAEISDDWKRNEEAHKKPLASYYEAKRRFGSRQVSDVGRYTRWSPHSKSETFKYSSGPDVLKYFHEEQALSDDIEKLNLRLIKTHTEHVRARVTLAYTETIDLMVTDERNRAVGVAVEGATGRVSGDTNARDSGTTATTSQTGIPHTPFGVKYTVPPFNPGASPMGSVDSEGFNEARWREPDRGWVRDAETREFVDADLYLEKHKPYVSNDSGMTQGIVTQGGTPKPGPPDSESRARALRRIKAEWIGEDEVGGSMLKSKPAPTRNTPIAPNSITRNVERRNPEVKSWTPKLKKPEPSFDVLSKSDREARLIAANDEAKVLREQRAALAVKQQNEEQRWREQQETQAIRVARKEIDAEDDARALELFRLRDENATLKSKLDKLFHERLIKPGEVMVDTTMDAAKAEKLSDSWGNWPFSKENPENSTAKKSTKVFRGIGVRVDERCGESRGVDVEVGDSRRDQLSYPGGFQREIEARKQNVEDRRKQALKLRSKNVNDSIGGRWSSLGS